MGLDLIQLPPLNLKLQGWQITSAGHNGVGIFFLNSYSYSAADLRQDVVSRVL